VIDETCTWADILEPGGWAFVADESDGAQRWLRPGDASSEYSARAYEHNLVCHSESAGLPSGAGQRLTKARVYAYLWHGDSVSEAVKALLRGENRGSLPAALDRDEVIDRFVDAVIAHGGEDAALGEDELRGIAGGGWDAGRAEPMLPPSPHGSDANRGPCRRRQSRSPRTDPGW
jgi:hypothetical protein